MVASSSSTTIHTVIPLKHAQEQLEQPDKDPKVFNPETQSVYCNPQDSQILPDRSELFLQKRYLDKWLICDLLVKFHSFLNAQEFFKSSGHWFLRMLTVKGSYCLV